MEEKLNANEKTILEVIKDCGDEGIDTINFKLYFKKKMRYVDLILGYRNLLKFGLISKTPTRVDVEGKSVIASLLIIKKKK